MASHFRIWKHAFYQRWPWFVAVFAVGLVGLMLIVVLFFWWFFGQRDQKVPAQFLPETLVVRSPSVSFDLTATHDSASGAFVDTAFALAVSEPLAKSAIEDSLVIEPRFDYTLRVEGEDGDDSTFLIVPKQALAANTLYHFILPKIVTADQVVLHPFSWAYQTQGPLTVTEVSPVAEATEVSPAAAVEITFSSDAWDAVDAQNFFHVTPEVPGDLTKQGRRLVFTPAAPWPQRRVITVTLDADFALRDGGSQLGVLYNWSFETGVPGVSAAHYYDGGAIVWKEALYHAPQNFRPGLDVTWHHAEAPAPEFRVWKLPEADFVQQLQAVSALPAWSLYGRGGYAPDTAAWEAVQTFGVSAVQQLSEAGTETQVVIPAGLERGWYVLQADYHGERQFALLQVSNIVVFAETTQTDNIVWAHNVVSDQPVGGARVSFVDFPAVGEFVLDDRGLARWRYPDAGAGVDDFAGAAALADAANILLKVVDAEGSVFYVPAARPRAEKVFTASVSVDGGSYAPGGDVDFWGVAAPRVGDASPRQVQVRLLAGDVADGASGGMGAGSVLAAQDVSLDANFVFSGQLTVPADVAAMPATLQVLSVGQILAEQALLVQTPTYGEYAPFTLQLTTPERVVVSGDVVDVMAQAEFVDGSPVADLELEDESGRVVGKTDKDGRLKTQVQFFAEDIQTPSLQQTYTVRPHDSQFHFLTTDLEFTVFQSDLFIDIASSKVVDDEVELILEARRLDTALGSGGGGNVVPDQAIVIEISSLETQQRADGTFFDVETQTQKPYLRSTQKKTVMDARRVITDTNGRARFTFPYVAGRSYDAILQARDDSGRILAHVRPVFAEFGAGEVGLVFSKERYAAGDSFQAQLIQDGVPVAAQTRDDFLFLRTQADFRSEVVSDQPEYGFALGDEDAPYTDVAAVWYDGFDYQVFQKRAAVDYSAGALTVKATLDKESYAAGDTGKVQVTTQTLAGAPAVSTVVVRVASVAHDSGGVGAEVGTTDGQAVFKTVATNAKGEADVKFTVPDGVGDWRLSAAAVSAGVASGAADVDFTVQQPLTIDLDVPDFFLPDDQPTLQARVRGGEMTAEDTVTFQAEIPDLDFQLTWHAAALTFSSLVLPDLPTGSHRLVVDITSGDVQQRLEKTLHVVDSPYVRPALHELTFDGQKLSVPEGADSARLRFIDTLYAPLIQQLYAQAWPAGGDMADMYAAYVSRLIIRDYWPDETPDLTLNAPMYQNADGGLALVPGGQSQVSFSARVAAENPDPFDRSAMKKYFWQQISAGQVSVLTRAYAYYGLASLGEPVLPTVVEAFQQEALSPEERVVYALAAERMGAGELAYKQYVQVPEVNSALFLLLAARLDYKVFATVVAGLAADDISALDRAAVIRALFENRPAGTGQSVTLTVAGEALTFDRTDRPWFDVTAAPRQEIIFPAGGADAAATVTPFLLTETSDISVTSSAGAPALPAEKNKIARSRVVGGRPAQVVAPGASMKVQYTLPSVTSTRELAQTSCIGVFEPVPTAVTVLPTASVLATERGVVYTCSPFGTSGSFGYYGYARLPGTFVQLPGLATDSEQGKAYATERDILVVEP